LFIVQSFVQSSSLRQLLADETSLQIGVPSMRLPKPWFRKQTGKWYVEIDKTQHGLGPDKQQAIQKYHELMAGRQPADTTTPAATIIGHFLAWSQQHAPPATHGFYSRPLVSFVEAIGNKLKVCDLKPFHVTRWLDARYKGKSSNYGRNAVRAVQRAFNWAVDEGYLDRSPVKGIKKPRATPRDVLITPDSIKRIQSAVDRHALTLEPAHACTLFGIFKIST
jgi:integrase